MGCIAVGRRPRVRVLEAWTPGRAHRMQEAVYGVLTLVRALVVDVPIGTNLGLLHLFWMLLSGKALLTRGAIIPGLSAVGLSAGAVRRGGGGAGGGGGGGGAAG